MNFYCIWRNEKPATEAHQIPYYYFIETIFFHSKLSEQHEGNDVQIESTYDKVGLENMGGSPKDSRNKFSVETSADIDAGATLFLSKAWEERAES